MKALTLHQPYASLIACGVKTLETRTWPTSHRGELVIHAGKKPYRADVGAPVAPIPYGAYLCVVELIACYPISGGDPEVQRRACFDFKDNRWGWSLVLKKTFDPISALGKMGLWTVPEHDASAIAESPIVYKSFSDLDRLIRGQA